ncbi:unnamed protein product [Pipistrellus nathusii]|uniref:Uncharacterized protein n=1 Tax=Pipistrellus nathusii TaxID=59473 RepID=A0ABP0AI35_PIPNA
MKGKAWKSLCFPGSSARLSGGDTPVPSAGCPGPLLAGSSLNPKLYLFKPAPEKGQRNASHLGTVLERKCKIPSAQNVPQEDKNEVAPTEHPQRGREMGHR